MKPKISIIVPVYKVENYLRKCIDSILAQTFTDFELILIDDGSPDSCGKICDEYAKKDSRVIVVHKENGGLSSARNAGLEIAKGDFVGFVDSDDWIEMGMYEMLYQMCIENNCEMAICSSMIHFKNKIVENGGHSLVIHDRDQAMKAMLEGAIYDEVVWTKLIKRNVMEKIRFSVGITYEDTAFTYKVIHNCNRICSLGIPMYHYIKRDNSSMAKALENIRIDAVIIYDEMYKFMEKYYPELRDLVALKLANSAMVVLNLISYHTNFYLYKKEYLKVTLIVNKYFGRTIQLKDYPYSVKLLLIATKIQPKLYKLLINLRRKIHEGFYVKALL